MEDVLVAAKKDRDLHWAGLQVAFHRMAPPLIDIRGAWDSSVVRAGLDELEFHDLRRSGVRNLSRVGVPEAVIMSIAGHRTKAMFDRSNILDEAVRMMRPRW
jgi:integrase